MRIEYDEQADALYIQLRAVHPADNIDIEEGVTVDLDADGHVIGIEVLDAVERLGATALRTVTVEGVALRMRTQKGADLSKPSVA